LHELGTQSALVCWRLVTHFVDLIERAQVFGRVFMAVQAEAHVKSLLFDIGRHLIDTTMTELAANAFIDVDLVAEVDKPGQPVHPVPNDWLAGLPALPDGSQGWTVGRDLAVTGHTGFGGRQVSKIGFVNE
jgi:hypothetical protein